MLTHILSYQNRINNFIIIREYNGQRRPVFWHVLHSVRSASFQSCNRTCTVRSPVRRGCNRKQFIKQTKHFWKSFPKILLIFVFVNRHDLFLFTIAKNPITRSGHTLSDCVASTFQRLKERFLRVSVFTNEL